jgi:hypothetical protein
MNKKRNKNQNHHRLISLSVPGFLLVMAGLVCAQPAGFPPPPRLILAPQGNMKWRITVKTEEEKTGGASTSSISSTPSSSDPTEIDYSYSGDWTHLEIHLGPSVSLAWWVSHGYVLTQRNATSPITVSPMGAYLPSPYDPPGFYGVSRVQPADDQGNAEFQGKVCRYYHAPAPSGSTSTGPVGNSAPAHAFEAWFDVHTGMPVAYREGNKTYVFEFLPAAPGEFEVPPEWKAMLKMRLEN